MTPATKTDWQTQELSSTHRTVRLDRTFSPPETRRLRSGLVPGQMEDKWFIYWQDDALYFHRSWTGFCIYAVRFETDGDSCRMFEADLNRERSQYSQTDDEHDAAMISYLIDVLLLDREADFPTDAADRGEAALEQWSQVGRAMLDEPREQSFEEFRRILENGGELVQIGPTVVATGELYEEVRSMVNVGEKNVGERPPTCRRGGRRSPRRENHR